MRNNTNYIHAPKIERTDQFAKLGIVGSVVAIGLSVVSLLGPGASADGGVTPTACIRAESDSGQFMGQTGGCELSTDTPTAPVPQCDDTDDAVAGQLATAQAKVASLDRGKEALQAEIGTAIESIIRSSGSVQPGTTSLRTFDFRLDDDSAIEAICAGKDPLQLVQYKISSTTPLKSFGIGVGSLAASWQGVVGDGSPTLTYSAPSGVMDASGPMLEAVTRTVQSRVTELLSS